MTTERQARLTGMLGRIQTVAEDLMTDTATIKRITRTEGGDARLSETLATVGTSPVRVRYSPGNQYESELLHTTGANVLLHFPSSQALRPDDVIVIGGKEFKVLAIARAGTHIVERVVVAYAPTHPGEELP